MFEPRRNRLDGIRPRRARRARSLRLIAALALIVLGLLGLIVPILPGIPLLIVAAALLGSRLPVERAHARFG